MIEITFRYKDKYSNWEWREQHCTMKSLEDCIKWYGLDEDDCEYEIISLKPLI